MPKGAMGHVPQGALPEPAPAQSALRAEEDRRLAVETGMTREQREMFQDLTTEVKYKKERLAEIDAEDEADPKPSKARTGRNKEALQLQNDVARCLGDMDRLLEITESA